MEEFCKKKGFQHQYTTSYTPEQNGVAERFNRTIAENMRAMLYHAKLPKKFWTEPINTAVYLKNRSPHSYLDGLTPFEIFHGQKPNLSHLRVFGCLTTSCKKFLTGAISQALYSQEKLKGKVPFSLRSMNVRQC